VSVEDDLIALEARVLEEAGRGFFAAVAEIRRLIAQRDPGVDQLILRLTAPRIEDLLTAGIREAYTIGGTEAADVVSGDPQIEGPAKVGAEAAVATGVPSTVLEPALGIDGRLADSIRRAQLLVGVGSPVEEAAGPVFEAANHVTRTTTSSIVESANRAVLDVADVAGQPLVWVAERDGCVYCLSLAGHVLKRSGDNFPKADRFSDGSTGQVTVQQPPLHPHCRCTLEVLVDESYAVALKREAERSILRGFSLQSESNAVRLRAAELLLADPDLVAPKSVKEYARRAVKNKQFPRGRDVPSGGPRLVVT
jgi:hypothetical protein